mmetsp:Transcript_81834/g.226753  ORF Transcript_81834/g.226753 Transcript_81834/m.226753 type:complete len:305 (-) Transcript_81834:503-1417(-)
MAAGLDASGGATVWQWSSGSKLRLVQCGPYTVGWQLVVGAEVRLEHLGLLHLQLCLLFLAPEGRIVVDVPAKHSKAISLVPHRVKDVLMPHQVYQLGRHNWLLGEPLDQEEHPAVLLHSRTRRRLVPDMVAVVALQLGHETLQVQSVYAVVFRPRAMHVTSTKVCNPRRRASALLVRRPNLLLQRRTWLGGAADHGAPTSAAVVNTTRQALARREGRLLAILAQVLDEHRGTGASNRAMASLPSGPHAPVWRAWAGRGWNRSRWWAGPGRSGDGDSLHEHVRVWDPDSSLHRQRVCGARAIRPQ